MRARALIVASCAVLLTFRRIRAGGGTARRLRRRARRRRPDARARRRSSAQRRRIARGRARSGSGGSLRARLGDRTGAAPRRSAPLRGARPAAARGSSDRRRPARHAGHRLVPLHARRRPARAAGTRCADHPRRLGPRHDAHRVQDAAEHDAAQRAAGAHAGARGAVPRHRGRLRRRGPEDGYGAVGIYPTAALRVFAVTTIFDAPRTTATSSAASPRPQLRPHGHQPEPLGVAALPVRGGRHPRRDPRTARSSSRPQGTSSRAAARRSTRPRTRTS